MAVAAEGGPERGRALGHRLALDRLQAAQVDRDLAGQGLADRPLGDLADPGQVAEAGPGAAASRASSPGSVASTVAAARRKARTL